MSLLCILHIHCWVPFEFRDEDNKLVEKVKRCLACGKEKNCVRYL